MRCSTVVLFACISPALSRRVSTQNAKEALLSAETEAQGQKFWDQTQLHDWIFGNTAQTVDISSVIGTGTTGIGAIQKETSGVEDWAPWGLSLSGNGLMAEAAAVGVLRALSQSDILDKISTISSVSGGTWFNAMFGFSERYYNAVTSGSQTVEDWYKTYQGDAMGGMSDMSSWEAMIGGMFTGFESGLDTKNATNAGRTGNKNADLLFCTTLTGGGLMSDNKTIAQLKDGSVKFGDGNAFFSNPAFWLMSSETDKWVVPGINLANAQLVNSQTQETSTKFDKILPTPTVAKIGAMSSAANGITANKELIDSFQPRDQFAGLFGSQNPTNGVCTTPGKTCEFPSMVAIDGCYVDNLGFALNVGHLQKKFPGKHLRVMAVSALICDRTADPTCADGVRNSAFRSLFKDSPYPEVEGWLPAIVPGPSRIIFAESITDVQALGQQTGVGGMTFTTGTFTTVQNDRFGVAAGTKVSILILNVNGPTYLQGMGPGVPYGGMDGLSSVADHAYRSMNIILGAIEENDRITSDSAFLYFQSVQANAGA